jgi:hypothetical protein
MAEAEQKPIADLPGGDPIPSKGRPVPAPAKSVSLGALLAAAPSNIDAFLAHLHRCMQTPSGIDTVLLFLCYTTRFGGAVLENLSKSALRRSARSLIALAFSLPPDTTIVLPASPASPAAVLALQLAAKLKAISALASDARTITRLWALLGMYFWGRRLIIQPKADGKAKQTGALDKTIAWTQFISCVIFQGLENVAYLGQRNVLTLTPASIGAAYKWSVRFWALFVGIELGRLVIERLEKQKNGRDAATAEYKEWDLGWKKTFARNLAWAPLTVHWSMQQGFASDAMIGFLASIPGAIQMRDLWKNTA